jgi:endonuclease/exonuclease/phosphatase family metal-dependent hydrolase
LVLLAYQSPFWGIIGDIIWKSKKNFQFSIPPYGRWTSFDFRFKIGNVFWGRGKWICAQEQNMSYRKTSAVLRIIFSISIFFTLCFYHNARSVSPGVTAKGELELKVMTFNIRYGTADDGENRWENRQQMVIDVLRENQLDVVGLQEALDFQISQIRQGLSEFGQLGVAREDGKTKGEYCTILYRRDRFDVNESGTFWFSDTPEVPGSNQWGGACVRICTWARLVEKKTGNAFYHYNLHLDHVSQPSREKSAVLLAQRIRERKHPDPFIVTGDFNAGENNPAVMYLRGKAALSEGESKSENPVPAVDTFRVLHPDANEVGTFNQFAGNRKGEKIDFIFTLPDVQVLESQIVHTERNGRYPSDHFPVTARLRLPAGGENSP